MKTFFIALILGIFVGSITTHYFSDPDAYNRLKEAKTRLLNPPTQEPPAEPVPETVPPAMFQVGSDEYKSILPDSQTADQSTPAPKINPNQSPEPKKPTDSPAKPDEEPELTQTPEPENSKTRADELIEQGTKKAEEIAETVTEKAKEVAKDAQPYLETGIDLTIATTIRAQFKLERRIDSDALRISVKDRAVTLSGTVPSADVKQLAIEIAVFTKGVTGVEENLTIAP